MSLFELANQEKIFLTLEEMEELFNLKKVISDVEFLEDYSNVAKKVVLKTIKMYISKIPFSVIISNLERYKKKEISDSTRIFINILVTKLKPISNAPQEELGENFDVYKYIKKLISVVNAKGKKENKKVISTVTLTENDEKIILFLLKLNSRVRESEVNKMLCIKQPRNRHISLNNNADEMFRKIIQVYFKNLNATLIFLQIMFERFCSDIISRDEKLERVEEVILLKRVIEEYDNMIMQLSNENWELFLQNISIMQHIVC